MTQEQRDAEHLLRQPEFLRFLSAAIHAAGIVGQQVGADGHLTRDLSFLEGRRSLGFELLHMAHAGQPEQIRASDTQALTTLTAALRQTLNSQDKPNERRRTRNDRYADIPDTDA
ncbi:MULTISPECIES: hypothetical protein [unclassified Novosphingobium]|uniref:hypothetical protein n=1 Tax=unclassified Novosphingobium TaxID=2644732 RepID=UPI000D31D0AE|nr:MULTISPECIES: hypothetical protein [unclassified Novosphingobium]PTR05678.1 hypothetical protein C8K11_1278 [Novosphingobium sp. GV055]PUA94246.1 hypothetical protein C8K12_1278 [Novosphingobium sp. GV061]PUB12349.1 hypothetical protein C8K14_1278 [Novosphingobium sp. GV079]PUB37263.1 hypothetical protein C8K10_1278 [Novosphingobium sp. GV027]